MKIREDFVLQEIADEFIVVPIAKEAERVKGIIKLNETGAYLWRQLSNKDRTLEEIIHDFASSYSLDQARANCEVKAFIYQIKEE